MTALCGYNNGDYNSPVACRSGFGCVEWQTPAVFGCTDGASTILPTTCVEVDEQSPIPTDGVIVCSSDAPYCATISLYWSDSFYTHWECNTQAVDPVTILATPTVTGDGGGSTQYLNEAFSDPSTASPSTESSGNGDTGKGSGSSSNIILPIVGAISGAIAAAAAVLLWICTKRHYHKQRQHELLRAQDTGQRQDLVVRSNRDIVNVTGEIERGRAVNVFVNELHWHDHAGRGPPGQLRLNA